MSRNVLEELRRLGKRKYEKEKSSDTMKSPMDFNLQQIRVKDKEFGCSLAFEMMEIIFSYLTYPELLLTISLTCKGWDLMSSTNLIWEQKYRMWFRSIHLAEKSTKFLDISWKHSFMLRLESFQRWRKNDPIISYYNLTKEEFEHPERVAARERMKTYRKRIRYFPGEWEYPTPDPNDNDNDDKTIQRRKHLPIYFISMSINYVAIFDDEILILDKKTLERIGKVNILINSSSSKTTTTYQKYGRIKSLGPIYSLDFLEGTDILVISTQPIFERKKIITNSTTTIITTTEEENNENNNNFEIITTSFQEQGLMMFYILEKNNNDDGNNKGWKIKYEEEYNIQEGIYIVNTKKHYPYIMIFKNPDLFKFINIWNDDNNIVKVINIGNFNNNIRLTSDYMDYNNNNEIFCFLGLEDETNLLILHFFHIKYKIEIQSIKLKDCSRIPQNIKFLNDSTQIFLSSSISRTQKNMIYDYRNGKKVIEWDTNISFAGGGGGLGGGRSINKINGDIFGYFGSSGNGEICIGDLYSGQVLGRMMHNGAGGAMTSLIADDMNLIIGTQFGAIIKRFYGPKEFYWSNMKGNILLQQKEYEEDETSEEEEEEEKGI